MKLIPILAIGAVLIFSCKKEKQEETTADRFLIFKFKFDSTQSRLNNIGQTDTIPTGNAAQSGKMNQMSAHYIELTPNAFTQLGKGTVVYFAEETSEGGSRAIDFNKAAKAGNGEEFFRIP